MMYGSLKAVAQAEMEGGGNERLFPGCSESTAGETPEDSFHDEDEQDTTAEYLSNGTMTSESFSNSSDVDANTLSREAHDNNIQPAISWFDASMHLIKGNLGPGCLNLPHAFGLSGWLLGNILFLFVVVQGIYSMILLAECKQILQRCQGQHGDGGRSGTNTVSTFMDVAHMSLGAKGHAFVQIFLFILQFGVCCVFLSLIATNLEAQTVALSQNASIGLVTLALLGIVLIRYMKDLRWLSTTANLFMLTAILTAAAAGMMQVREQDLPLPPKATNHLGDVATFISSMFFSFEGIGLVLPVENSFAASDTPMQAEKASSIYRTRVLPGAMTVVAALFWFIGFFGSWGFPDIENGSITAYLSQTFPDQPWFKAVNTLVMVAVFFTFPLQLTPALEVLNEWCSFCAVPVITVRNNGRVVVSTTEDQNLSRLESSATHFVLDRSENGVEQAHSSRVNMCFSRCWENYSWIIPRYLVVFGCAMVVLCVDDLGLLMALFGGKNLKTRVFLYHEWFSLLRGSSLSHSSFHILISLISLASWKTLQLWDKQVWQ